MDELVVAFALNGVEALQLGKGPQTDLLAVSLSATDVIGHRFGPDSREIHDQVLRVDRAVGVLLDSLFKLRDPSTVTVVLAADHGVGTIPSWRRPACSRARSAWICRKLLGPVRAGMAACQLDTLAIDIDQNLVFIDREAFKRAKVNADSVLDDLAKTLRSTPGVARVDKYPAILADSLKDPIARRWAHQFPPTAPIELIVDAHATQPVRRDRRDARLAVRLRLARPADLLRRRREAGQVPGVRADGGSRADARGDRGGQADGADRRRGADASGAVVGA